MPYAVVAKLANAPDLDSGGFSPCRFESGLPHTAFTTKVSVLESISFRLGFKMAERAEKLAKGIVGKRLSYRRLLDRASSAACKSKDRL